MNKLIAYIIETRAGILPTTILPALAGAGIAFHSTKTFSWQALLPVLFGFIFIHLGTNVLNDFFDAGDDGTDSINKEYISPFTGGSRLIQKGLLTPKEVLAEAIVLFAVAAALLIYAAFTYNIAILFLAVFGMTSGIFYSSPPLKISTTGFGEFLVSLNCGPVIALSAYCAQANEICWLPAIITFPLGLLTANFVWAAEFPDFNADKAAGKANLVVRMGREKARIGYIMIAALAYLIITEGIVMKIIPVFGITVLAALPVSIAAFIELWKKYDAPEKLRLACGLTLAAHLITGILLTTAFFK